MTYIVNLETKWRFCLVELIAHGENHISCTTVFFFPLHYFGLHSFEYIFGYIVSSVVVLRLFSGTHQQPYPTLAIVSFLSLTCPEKRTWNFSWWNWHKTHNNTTQASRIYLQFWTFCRLFIFGPWKSLKRMSFVYNCECKIYPQSWTQAMIYHRVDQITVRISFILIYEFQYEGQSLTLMMKL